MNWDAAGSIGEVVGAVAVVVSLVYLAIQIRQSTQQIARGIEATRLAAVERNIDSANRIRELLILNPELAELFRDGLKSFRKLNNDRKFRFGLLMSNTLSAFQAAYLRHLSVGGDPLDFEGPARMIDSILENPGARQWLDDSEPDWRPEFRRFVEARAAALDKQVPANADSPADGPQE